MEKTSHLKPLVKTDVEVLHALLTVPEVYRYLADGVVPDKSVAIEWIGASLSDFDRYGVGAWSLSNETGTSVRGVVRLSDFAAGSMELTYLLHPDLWGRGLATSMAHTALSLAFTGGHVASVWAGADKPNRASIAVMQRLGMTIRKQVHYPAGEGVEYTIDRHEFDADRLPRLPVLQSNP